MTPETRLLAIIVPNDSAPPTSRLPATSSRRSGEACEVDHRIVCAGMSAWIGLIRMFVSDRQKKPSARCPGPPERRLPLILTSPGDVPRPCTDSMKPTLESM